MTVMENIKTWPLGKKIVVGVGAPLAIVGAGLLAADIASSVSRPEKIARESCERQVTLHAKYPGSVNFIRWSERDPKNGDGTYSYSGTVDFANGWGTPVRHFFYCDIKGPGGLDEVEVAPFGA